MNAAASRSPAPRFGPTATRQAQPHRYDQDPDAPGVCRCHLVKSHRLHDEAAIRAHLAEVDAAHAEERRRLGEAD